MDSYRRLIVMSGLLALFGNCTSNYAVAQLPKLEPNDVSWLWPVPKNSAELDKTISISSLNQTDGLPVWSDAQFQSILNTVASVATEVGGSRVEFDPEFSIKGNWRIAGMRIDPTAPGGHESLRGIFGSSVQIRLIIQPVTVNGSRVTVHDTTVHLVYSFVKPRDNSNPQVNIPDNEKFEEILDDIRWLKAVCKAAGVTTMDLPLGVHPGLEGSVPGLLDELKRFLGKHLSPDKLSAMALMGIESGAEPWIFLALGPKDGVFGPLPINAPFAKPQMINFRSSPGKVEPTPVVNNRPTQGSQSTTGVATNILFGISSSDLRDFATIGIDENGEPIKDTKVKNTDIPDVIANPTLSNFFNTDCISCHTESQRRSTLGLPSGDFAFKVAGQSPQRASDVTSSVQWNVRNFGWFPDFFRSGQTVPTATQRTANETAEVLAFIQENFSH